MSRPARIFLICSVPFIRRGLINFFAAQPDLVLSGMADTFAAASTAIPHDTQDLLVMDLGSSVKEGGKFLDEARQAWPSLPILVFSSLDEATYALGCYRAGAGGFLNCAAEPNQLALAIRTILTGSLYVSPSLAQKLLRDAIASDQTSPEALSTFPLTQREREVFGAIGRGLTTRQIALKLKLSIKTVETYRKNLKSKIRLRSSRELKEFARRQCAP